MEINKINPDFLNMGAKVIYFNGLDNVQIIQKFSISNVKTCSILFGYLEWSNIDNQWNCYNFAASKI
jgi:hypothetical protein